jgi:hypothetical protein
MKAAREVFGDNFVSELQEILTSTSTVTTYGPDGREQATTDQPFTHPWQLLSIGIPDRRADPHLGSRQTTQ